MFESSQTPEIFIPLKGHFPLGAFISKGTKNKSKTDLPKPTGGIPSFHRFFWFLW